VGFAKRLRKMADLGLPEALNLESHRILLQKPGGQVDGGGKTF
jgi:hypothetical protein